jgi:outer membrane beta-barrel protein
MGKGRGMTITKQKTTKRLVSVLAAALALFAFTERAEAQQILLTGPLAGAPAVRKLRLHRKGRLEVAPAVSFTLLDEYQRTILVGAKLNYHFTDWLAFGAWGAFGAAHLPTHLTEQIQEVNSIRRTVDPTGMSRDRTLTAVNLGPDFEKQLGTMDWVVAPQLTAVPFRGKLALFQSIYLDTDLYFFAGPAFVGLNERKNCAGTEADPCVGNFAMASRVAIAPTFGLGFNFYINKWAAIGFEYRGLPFSWNTGGFDTAGGGQDKKFPDNKITNDDRQFNFNQLLTLSFNVYLPFQYKVSE